MEAEVSILVDRPPATVWDFYAVHHIENHPRWDPDIELEATSDEPIGVGTVLKRRNRRYGTPTEGTMEIVEFVPERAMAARTLDGEIQINGRATLTPEGEDATLLTLWAHIPGMEDSMAERIRPLMQRSAENIKRLIESQT